MFEKFTESARRAVLFARAEASRAGSSYIEAEHLILGLFREKDNVFKRVLTAEEAESLRGEVAASIAGGSNIGHQEYPLSQALKHALAWGAEAASNLTHAQIGPEHLLLGLLKDPNLPVAYLLKKYRISEETLTLEAAKQAVPKGSIGALVGGFGAGGAQTHRTSTRLEEGVHVRETHQLFAGHEITVIERMQINDGGSVLHYLQEIRGPKKEHRFEVDFELE